MTDSITWGVIGCGKIAVTRIIPGILGSRNARLAALMDSDPACAESAARKFNADFWTGDLDKFLNCKGLDAVYVSSPVAVHHDHVIRSAESGKHVLCEKPMALTVADCAAMAEACRRAGVKLQIGFMMRFHPAHQKVKELIDAGELGELIQGRAQLSHYHVEWNEDGSRNWRQFFTSAGGGSLMDMGIHCVDLLRWWMGEVRSVSAMTATLANDYEVEDTALVLLRMDKGKLATVDSTYAARGARHVFEIYGTEGAARGINTISQLAEGNLSIVRGAREEAYSFNTVDLYTAEIEHFHDCIRTERQPLVGPEEGQRNLEACLAAYRSNLEQRVIVLE
jgi:predicted dehydrogenase